MIDAQNPTNAQKRPRLINRLQTPLAVAVLVVGLVSTLLLVRAEFQHAERTDKLRFDRLVERVRGEVVRRVTVYRYGLMGTRSVFAASEHVNRQEFIHLVASRELEQEFPGSLGIGYIERVPSEPVAFDSFVQDVREDEAPWFEITIPPGSGPLEGALTDDRYIIKYIEPLAANRAAHGLDIGAHPVRREAAERAMINGYGALTGTIQLVQDQQKVAGFLYLVPHYKPGVPVETQAQRIEALVGWTYMPVLGPDVFTGITKVANGELDIEVFGGGTLREDLLIYDSDSRLTSIREHKASAHRQHSTVPIDVGGQTWTLAFNSTPSFAGASRAEFWMVGVLGASISILVAMLVYLQGSSTRRAWSMAEGMTTDLRDYAQKAEQATQAKSDFLANMSHEIRTPMTAILGFTDVLRAQIDEDNRDLLEHTRTIKRNGEHLLSLINDILDVSKIEAGKVDVEHIAVRPDLLVHEVLSLMRVKADEKKLPLNARFMTRVPAEIKSDPVRLRQILVNLVGNAIKFTDKGSVDIEVRFDDKMNKLKFAVKDTGIGMTDEQLARLFGAFQQADSTTTREFGGTGLGLHISQRLAQMLGGEIVCNSAFGEGSTFTLTIDTDPVTETTPMTDACEVFAFMDVKQARETSSAAQSAIDEVIGNRPPLTGLSILLAEDGKDNQRLINHHLTKAGARVKIVENGRLAVEELCVNRDITGPLHKHPSFDLLLTDMQMPDMDGYTAVRLLRELGSTLPVVALTAHAMAEDIDKCLDAGCDFYASKPIDKQKLIAICLEAAQAKQPA